MSYKNVSIILSTYNESLDIESTVKLIIKNLPDCEIVIVDDNSPDGTFEIIKKINYPYLKIFCREKTKGLASAFLLGLIESKGEIIGWIDTNMGFLSEKLPEMVKILSNYDMVVLSRYVEGGSASDVIVSIANECFAEAIVIAAGSIVTRDASMGFKATFTGSSISR